MVDHARIFACGGGRPRPGAAQLWQFRLDQAPVPWIGLGELPVMIAMANGGTRLIGRAVVEAPCGDGGKDLMVLST